MIGIVQSCLTAFTDVHIGDSARRVPQHDAVRAGDRRPAVVRPARGRWSQDVVAVTAAVRIARRRRARRRPRAPADRAAAPRWSLPQPGPAGRRRRARRLRARSACRRCSTATGCRSMTGVGDLQHRHARPRPADRPGRDGLAVPVRARSRSGRGSRCGSSYATSIPFPLLLLIAGVRHRACSARSSACRRCGCRACTSR